METLLKCPITDEEINAIAQENYIQYVLVYNDNSYNIRLSQEIEWYDQSKIIPEHKNILKGMLYNNEWPIEGETVVTSGLIEQIIMLGEYPRTFNEKIDYFLLKCYLDGGSEYKPILEEKMNFLSAYAHDIDEFYRIKRALVSKQFIKEPSITIEGVPSSFNLTELGIEKSEELNRINIEKENVKIDSIPRPSIKVIVAEGDSYYGQKLHDLLLKCGFKVSFIDELNDTNGYSIVTNNRASFYSDETDYVVFIKSAQGDRTHSFGSMLDIAMEAHQKTPKRNFEYIYIANIEDLNLNARPRISDYSSTTFDFRIVTNRQKLVKKILRDWKRRGKSNTIIAGVQSKFQFPVIKLTEYEKIWLEAVYQKFLSDQNLNYRSLWATIWDKSPIQFDPSRMNHSLIISGTDITLLGIWHIDPGSDIFEKYDKVILAIREILKSSGENNNVSSEQIQDLTTGISAIEIKQITKLMYAAQFVSGYGSGPNFSSYITINDDETFNKFRHYNGLQQHMEELFKRYNNEGTLPEEEEVNEPDDDNFEGVHSHKTAFLYKDKLAPVMGVTSLAIDLAEIIESFPAEKGQMVGIFGKWGRGKTVLLTELWKVLQLNESPKYTRVDYHAWKYQETPASWAYLYETLAAKYLDRKDKGIQWAYYKKLLHLNYKRLGSWPLVQFGFTIIATVVSSVAAICNDYGLIVAPILVLIGISFLIKLGRGLSTKASDLIKKYSDRHSFKEALGMQADIQDELIKLLKVWIPDEDPEKRRIILFVEDIDRCTEERVMQNIDALRIMLDDDDISERMVIVTAIDERILKNAIKEKYASFKFMLQEGVDKTEEEEESIETKRLAAEYIDKAFIAAIKLGNLNNNQKEEYLNALFEKEVDPQVLASAKITMKKSLKTESAQKAASQEVNDSTHPLKDLSPEMEGNIENEIKPDFSAGGSHDKADANTETVDKNEEYTNTKEIASEVKEGTDDQNRFEKLSETEVIALTELIKGWSGSTPRRIRIFYYRYLLCKNLVINKYAETGKFNIWQNEKGIKTLMALILYYTRLHDPSMIAAKRNEIASATEQRIKISEIPESINAPIEDYLILFEILELVIAY